MKEFLEYLIPKYLILQLIIIFGFLFYVIIRKRKKILFEIKKHKIVYFLLFIFFITALFIRVPNIGEKKTLYAMDSFYYLIEATQINLEGKYSFVCDAPAYPILLSLFQKIYGYKVSLNSALNSIIGSFTVILLFIFTLLLFKNRTVALISSVILVFDPFHVILAADGYQAGTSIFFTLLSMILLVFSSRTKSFFGFGILGLVLGFTAQIYYIEVIFLLISLIYVLLRNKFSYTALKIISTLLIFFIISILPFLILQSVKDNNCGMKGLSDNINTDRDYENNLFCRFAKNYCRLYNIDNIFNNPSYQVEYINNEDGHLLSNIMFLFLGKGRFAVHHFEEFWSNNSTLGKYNFIYLFYSIFIIIGILKLSLNKSKGIILLLLIIFLNIILLSSYYNIDYKMVIFMGIFMIPLVSFGLYSFSKEMFNNKFIRNILIVIIIIILISSFFREDIFANINSNKHIRESDLIKLQLDKRCEQRDSVPEYLRSCNLIINKFLSEHKENIKIQTNKLE